MASKNFKIVGDRGIEGQRMVLRNQTSDPAVETDQIALYKKNSGSGGSGVYFKNDTDGTTDELVSKKKAITFGLIF